MLDAFLKSMSIIPVLIVGIGSLLIVRHQGMDRSRTVSVHAALNPKASFILSLLILVCGTLYFLALWLWVAPKYELPFMGVIVALAYVAGYVLGLFPANPDYKWSSRLHTSAGVVLVLLMYVFALLVAFSSHLTHPFAITMTWIFLIFGLILALVRLAPGRMKLDALALEVLYIGMFYVLAIVLTYA